MIMKHFIITNRYRLTTVLAMLIFALAFFVFVLKYNVARAGNPPRQLTEQQQSNIWIVANGKGIYEVTLNNVDGRKTHSCKRLFDENGK